MSGGPVINEIGSVIGGHLFVIREPEHPDVALSLENYAVLLRQTGRGSEAAEMEARAKEIQTKHAEQSPAK